MIELHSIYKNFAIENKEFTALNNISLSIKRGEFVAIMGPSGSGKSTLMNIIGCLDRPSKGKYLLNGKEVNNLEDVALSRIRNQFFGFVFQNFELIPRLSALKNVEIPAIYAGLKKKNIRELANRSLIRLGLECHVFHHPSQLSGGQKQRVAIARALINSPEVIIADEPTGSLDSDTSIRIMDVFKELNDEGVTIIVVTHDEEVARSCNRVIRIKDGMVNNKTKKCLMVR